MTNFASFLSGVFADGRAVVPDWHDELTTDDSRAASEVIVAAHRTLAAEAPGLAPDLQIDAAIWGCRVFHWSSWILLNRSEENTALPTSLSRNVPSVTAANHWSVDIGLQHLFSVIRQIRKWADEEALLNTLLETLAPWPLSALGTGAHVPEASLQLLLATDCLRFQFRDRIIQRRISPEYFAGLPAECVRQIENLLRESAGIYSELLPPAWKAAFQADDAARN